MSKPLGVLHFAPCSCVVRPVLRVHALVTHQRHDSLGRGQLLDVDETSRIGVKEALCHLWLDDQNHADEMRWTDAERKLVSAKPGARSLAVLQSVARMYGEEPPTNDVGRTSELSDAEPNDEGKQQPSRGCAQQ